MVSVSLKHTVLAGAAALSVAGAAVGIVSAQQVPATPSARQSQHQQVIDKAAQELGVSPDKLSEALTDARQQLGLTHKGQPLHPFQGSFKTAADALHLAPK